MTPPPSKQLEAVLSGAASYTDAPAAIRSWASKAIYDMAIKIVIENDKEKRKKMLTDVPESYRHEVENIVRKKWPARQSLLRLK